jgi:hypothetical protein
MINADLAAEDARRAAGGAINAGLPAEDAPRAAARAINAGLPAAVDTAPPTGPE